MQTLFSAFCEEISIFQVHFQCPHFRPISCQAALHYTCRSRNARLLMLREPWYPYLTSRRSFSLPRSMNISHIFDPLLGGPWFLLFAPLLEWRVHVIQRHSSLQQSFKRFWAYWRHLLYNPSFIRHPPMSHPVTSLSKPPDDIEISTMPLKVWG